MHLVLKTNVFQVKKEDFEGDSEDEYEGEFEDEFEGVSKEERAYMEIKAITSKA